MALDRTKQYDILNYCPSPVSVSTRDLNELIPGGNSESPSRVPMKLDDIMFINANSRVFKDGILFFDPDIEAEMYDELRIKDWQNIMRDSDIEDIVLNPTIEKLERVLAINSVMMFERIYGVYVGLKNAGASITLSIQNLMDRRHKEISDGKLKTEIQVQPTAIKQAQSAEQMKAQMDAQAEELERLKAMVAQLTSAAASADTSEQKTDAAKPKSTKSAAKRTTKKTTEEPATTEA